MTKTPIKNSAKESPKWIACGCCSVLYSTTDEEKHREVCSAEAAGVINSMLSNPKHSAIYNQCLLATLSEFSGKETFPENWRGNFVFLHPETIAALGFADHDLKKVVVLDHRHAFRLWPHKGVALTEIEVHKEGLQRLQTDSYVTLAASDEDIPADEIHLEFKDEMRPWIVKDLNLQKLRETFFYYNEDRLFSVGEIVEFQYSGKIFRLLVRRITAGGKEYKSGKDAEIFPLVESISRLEISSTAEAVVQTNTPSDSRFFSLAFNYTRLFIHLPKFNVDSFGGYHLLKKRLLGHLENVLKVQPSSEDNVRHSKDYSQIMDVQDRPTVRALLLYGPSGVGKTMLVNAVVNTLDVPVFHLTPEHTQKRELLNCLRNNILIEERSVVFIDDIDVVCPKKDADATYAVRETLKQVLEARKRLFVFAATNKRDDVHEAIQFPGLITIAQKVSMPTIEDKIDILNCLLRSFKHSLAAEDVKELANQTQYFSGYDLKCLCKEAVTKRRSADDGSKCISPIMTLSDLTNCLPTIDPYMLKNLRLELPFVKMIKSDVSWDDIGGLRDVREITHQMVSLRLHQPQVFQRLKLEPLKGLLLFGPPGCSKTMIAKAVAKDCGINFLAVDGTSVFSKFVGSTEANIAKLFRKAREIAPCVIFFDEVETLAQSRNQDRTPGGSYQNRALQQMLVELDGIGATKDIVCVMAATNRPELLDTAFFRPGRFDRVVYIPLPDVTTRQEIFRVRLESRKLEDVQLEKLVNQTDGYSSVEVCELVREACDLAVSETGQEGCAVQMTHFETAFRKIRPRTTPQQITILEQFASRNVH